MVVMTETICAVEGCDRPARSRGWCNTHYERWRLGREVDAPGDLRSKPQSVCAVEGCVEPAKGRGWCNTHYARWRIHGDPNWGAKRGPMPVPPHERVLARIAKQADGCWIDPSTNSITGYGMVQSGELDKGTRRPRQSHRVVYEALVGPIPDGFEVDHLCKVVGCVNPAHLEAVTPAENHRRQRRWQLAKTHCPQGHAYDEANTYFNPSRPSRHCRKCRNERSRMRRARKKAMR